MDKRIYLNNLYDCYKTLFTDKQREYFEEYYYDNLSLSEIAENNDVSRNAVHNQLKIVETKLEDLEKNLKLFYRKKEILNLVSKELSSETLDKLNELL